MKCPNCGAEVNEGWKYCPRCGYNLKDDMFSGFPDISRIIEKMEKEMNRMLDKNIEVFDLSPLFRSPNIKRKTRGFTIKITSMGNKPPKVFVKTFGDVDKKDVIKEIGNLYHKTPFEPFEAKKEKKRLNFFKRPKITEEPESSVKRLESKLVVEVKLPEVKSEEDIEVTELENSVEIKAIAGEKAYFKILTKPPQHRLTGKSFKNGVLKLEFS
ncbi:MAG: hypothetical protein DRP18_04515 [Candidatus Aenigmatarchaeota archaeon]|nr:MAG: hypothetical protein DRP18_04515 [Candidatus Aenigmarchaeota archaeon]